MMNEIIIKTFKLAIVIAILSLVTTACSTPDAEKMIPYLNGYWEIEAVENGRRKH